MPFCYQFGQLQPLINHKFLITLEIWNIGNKWLLYFDKRRTSSLKHDKHHLIKSHKFTSPVPADNSVRFTFHLFLDKPQQVLLTHAWRGMDMSIHLKPIWQKNKYNYLKRKGKSENSNRLKLGSRSRTVVHLSDIVEVPMGNLFLNCWFSQLIEEYMEIMLWSQVVETTITKWLSVFRIQLLLIITCKIIVWRNE